MRTGSTPARRLRQQAWHPAERLRRQLGSSVRNMFNDAGKGETPVIPTGGRPRVWRSAHTGAGAFGDDAPPDATRSPSPAGTPAPPTT